MLICECDCGRALCRSDGRDADELMELMRRPLQAELDRYKKALRIAKDVIFQSCCIEEDVVVRIDRILSGEGEGE